MTTVEVARIWMVIVVSIALFYDEPDLVDAIIVFLLSFAS